MFGHSYIYQLSVGLGMRKKLAYGIRMQKKPVGTFSGFSWMFIELCVFKVNSHARTKISLMASLNLKSSFSDKNSLGELEQNYCDITQHVPRITES